MKHFPLSALAIIILSVCASAQPDTLWTKLYKDGYQAYGNSVKQTEDEGYIFTGSTTHYGNLYSDLYLVKTDANGELIWSKSYGGNFDDLGEEVQQTVDGGYIIVGVTLSFGFYEGEIYLIKTDANGDSLWTKTIGTLDEDWGASLIQDQDGGYVITGKTSPNPTTNYPILIKTDENGEVEWYRIYDFIEGKGSSVIQNQEGNYVIAGISYNVIPGYSAVFIMNTDTNGDTIWTNSFGGSNYDHANDIQQTSDGGYILAGGSESFGPGNDDVLIMKANSEGDSLWSKFYGGLEDDKAYSLDITLDGGCITAGKTRSFGAMIRDYYIVRTDSIGDSLWTLRLGGYLSDIAESIQQTSDGGYIVCGSSYSFGSHDYSEVWLIKLDSSANVVWEHNLNPPDEFELYPPFPNPFNGNTAISFQLPADSFVKLSVFDIAGREVSKLEENKLSSGIHRYVWNAEGFASGIYFVKLEAGEFRQTQKIVLLK